MISSLYTELGNNVIPPCKAAEEVSTRIRTHVAWHAVLHQSESTPAKAQSVHREGAIVRVSIYLVNFEYPEEKISSSERQISHWCTCPKYISQSCITIADGNVGQETRESLHKYPRRCAQSVCLERSNSPHNFSLSTHFNYFKESFSHTETHIMSCLTELIRLCHFMKTGSILKHYQSLQTR